MKLFSRRRSSAGVTMAGISFSGRDVCGRQPVSKSKSNHSTETLETTTTSAENSSSHISDDWNHNRIDLVTVSQCAKRLNLSQCRRVSFSKNVQYHESPWILVEASSLSSSGIMNDIASDITQCKSEISEDTIWFQRCDFRKFKNDTLRCSQLVLRREEEQREMNAISGKPFTKPWSQILESTYASLHQAATEEEMNRIMETAKDVDVHAFCVGLEKWVNDAPAARSRQRKALCATVAIAQGSGYGATTTAATSARELRKLCRQATRTNRLFAIYLARTVAANS